MYYPSQYICINVGYTSGFFGSSVVMVTTQLSLCFNMPCFVRLRFNSSSREANQLKFSDMVSNLMCLVFWGASLQEVSSTFRQQKPMLCLQWFAVTESWIICQTAKSVTVFFYKAINLFQVVQGMFLCSYRLNLPLLDTKWTACHSLSSLILFVWSYRNAWL